MLILLTYLCGSTYQVVGSVLHVQWVVPRLVRTQSSSRNKCCGGACCALEEG